MIAQESLATERARPPVSPEERVAEVVPLRSAGPAETSLLWRIILVMVGFGIAITGFALILTALMAFIGLPLFIFGLALMQAQERG
jgi:uncharacterized membrane protein